MSEAIIYRSSNIQGAGVFGYAPNPATNLTAKGKNAKVELKWTDPDDRVVEGTNVGWSYTRIVRKTGSYPTGPNDGTVVVQNSTKNQYQSTPYVDTGVVNNTTYYYAAYAFSDYGIPAETAPQATAKPVPYRVMTVVIDENDSNPATCATYEDDAIGMPAGKGADAVAEWQDFFGYKPCLFKDGEVVGYLNPNDYSKFEDGSSADITSGNAGDVMIEFPKRGLKITKTSDGKLRVSMTDKIDDMSYTYFAFTRDNFHESVFDPNNLHQIDKFYLGAYPASLTSTRIRSLSGSPIEFYMGFSEKYTPATIDGYWRTCAHNMGDGYELMTFWQMVHIQAMYLLEFKNPDSISALGIGMNIGADIPVTNGSGDELGLMHGEPTSIGSDRTPSKLFGLENFVSCFGQIVDGFMVDEAKTDVYIATTGFDSEPYSFGPTPEGSYGINPCWGKLSRNIFPFSSSWMNGRRNAGYITCVDVYNKDNSDDSAGISIPAFIPGKTDQYGSRTTTYGFYENLHRMKTLPSGMKCQYFIYVLGTINSEYTQNVLSYYFVTDDMDGEHLLTSRISYYK